MLQRAAETVSGDDECNDPAVLLACALGSTGCPAKCVEENQTDKNPNNAFNGVVAGDLNVAVSTSSSTLSIPNSGVIKVAELAAKASENIQLQSVDITREGLSTNKDIKVWIEKDGKRITSASSFFGDSKANLTFNNGGYVINGNETLDLVVSLSGVTAGSELQFKVSNLVSSAKNVTISPDTTGLFRTANYQATSISFVSMNNSDRSYNLADASSLSFGEFKLQNDSPASMEKDVLIRNITFKVDGSIENLTNFKLLRDSKEVSSKYTVDGKSVTFAVNDQLDSGKSATYKVTAEVTNIENEAGDNYTFSIRKSEDVIAEEIGSNATAYRVSINGDLPDLKKTTIKGGNITLTRDSSLASTVSADWGYSDVVIAKGTIKVNQAVKFESAYISGDATDQTTPVTGLDKVLRRATLVIDGKTYQAERKATGLSIDSEIYLSKGEHNVELQISLNNSATKALESTTTAAVVGAIIPAGSKIATAISVDEATSDLAADTITTRDYTVKAGSLGNYYKNVSVSRIKFQALDKNTFRGGNYTNGDETKFTTSSIAGNIRVSEVKVEEKVISVKKTGPSEDVKIRGGNTDEKVVLVGEISNTTDKVLEINKFNVTPTIAGGTTTELGDVYAVLGDNTSSTVAVKSSDTTNGVDIDSVTTTIEPGKSAKFELRIIPGADLVNPDKFRFAVKLSGKLGGNDTSSSALNSAYVIVNNGASTTIVANTTDNKLIVKPGVSTKVASFNYNVKSDSVDVESMTFTIAGFDSDKLDDLSIDFGGSIGAPGLTYKMNAGKLEATFNNIVTLPEANYKVNVYATFNENSIDTTTAGYATTDGTKPTNFQTPKSISHVDIKEATTTKGADLTFNHFVAKAYPILSVKDKNTTKDNERLDINIRKSNDDANTVKINAIGGTPAAISTDGKAGVCSETTYTDKESCIGATKVWTPYWYVAEGSETDLKAISLDANSATVIRASKVSGAQISNVDFLITDDEGHTVWYKALNAGSDFASLSL